MPQDVFKGAASSTRLTAFIRTLHCAEGTKNTAVAGPGSHDKAAAQTFIEIEAAVLGDFLGMRVAACRTRDNGFLSSHRQAEAFMFTLETCFQSAEVGNPVFDV